MDVVNAISFPLPDIEVVLLPFIARKGGTDYAGVTDYSGEHIYLSAIDMAPEPKDLSPLKALWAHEFGHAVQDHYLPTLKFGPNWPVTGPWQTFKEVNQLTLDNLTYETALQEAFAESWAKQFYPPARAFQYRVNGTWDVEGLREWFYSLTGQLMFRPDHPKAYKNGTVIPLLKAPRVEDGVTLLPLRSVAETLGAYVEWDGESIHIFK
jgi:hypothetical protein